MVRLFDFSDPLGILPTAGFILGAAVCFAVLYFAIAASMNTAAGRDRRRAKR